MNEELRRLFTHYWYSRHPHSRMLADTWVQDSVARTASWRPETVARLVQMLKAVENSSLPEGMAERPGSKANLRMHLVLLTDFTQEEMDQEQFLCEWETELSKLGITQA